MSAPYMCFNLCKHTELSACIMSLCLSKINQFWYLTQNQKLGLKTIHTLTRKDWVMPKLWRTLYKTTTNGITHARIIGAHIIWQHLFRPISLSNPIMLRRQRKLMIISMMRTSTILQTLSNVNTVSHIVIWNEVTQNENLNQ